MTSNDALDSTAQVRHHAQTDPHVRGRWLSDLVLGAQDGIVNTLGVVLGVASATADPQIVLATGLAAIAAESISMAAVAYTSSAARGELYLAERAREYRHIAVVPDVERAEVRDLFAAKGFAGDLLERATDVVCSNRDVWVKTMMAEEHGLAPFDRRESVRSAVVVGGASLVASTPLVLPFAAAGGWPAAGAAIAVAALLLFALGVVKARLTTGSAGRAGAQLVAIGLLSALAGYVVGALASR